jgi:hypothetical protein
VRKRFGNARGKRLAFAASGDDAGNPVHSW